MSSEHSLDRISSVEETVKKVLAWFPGKFDVNPEHIQVVFKDALTSPWEAKLRLASGLLKAFTPKKLLLVVWKGNWEGSDEYHRAFIIYEQLLRVRYNDKKKKYELRKHDIETFKEVLQEFGLNYENVKDVFDKAQQH